MTSIYRFHHLSGRSRQEVEGLVDRAGQEEEVAGRVDTRGGRTPAGQSQLGLL